MAREKLKLKDFDQRFSIDERGKLYWDNQIIETEVGLKKRDFILAVIAALAAWVGVTTSIVTAANNILHPTPPPLVTVFSPPLPPPLVLSEATRSAPPRGPDSRNHHRRGKRRQTKPRSPGTPPPGR